MGGIGAMGEGYGSHKGAWGRYGLWGGGGSHGGGIGAVSGYDSHGGDNMEP